MNKKDKQIKQFSEETGISKSQASNILSIIYEKGLDAKVFDRVLWRMRQIVQKEELMKIVNKMSKDAITTIVDQIVVETTNQWEICCSEGENVVFRSLFNIQEPAAEFKEFKTGDTVEIQVMRTGRWNHPMYWPIEISSKTLSEVKSNFEKNARQIDLAVDENHDPHHKALWWFKELKQKWKDSLFATIELTKKGAELLTEWAYKYFSPEIFFQKKDEETWKVVRNLLIGGAFTNRPFFKAMKPLLASEEWDDVAANRHQQGTFSDSSEIFIFNTSNPMLKFLKLLEQFVGKKTITKSERDQVQAAFNELSDNDKTQEVQAAFNETIALFNEDGDGSDEGAGAGEGTDSGEGQGEGSDAGEGSGSEWEGEGEGSDGSQSGEGGGEGSGEGEGSQQHSEVTPAMFAEYQKNASAAKKIVDERRKELATQKVQSFVFSESNKKGVVKSAHLQKVVDFALSLSEKQSNKFFEILGEVRNVDTTEKGGEGGSAATKKFTAQEEEKIAFFTEKMWQTREEAEASLLELEKIDS